MVTTGVNPEVHYTGGFQPYGSLRTIISIPANEQRKYKTTPPRVGINFSTFGPIKVIGTTEWAVNLVQSETTFNAGATTSSGFGVCSKRLNPSSALALVFLVSISANLEVSLSATTLHSLRHNELHNGSLQRFRRPVHGHLCCRHRRRSIGYRPRRPDDSVSSEIRQDLRLRNTGAVAHRRHPPGL